jgi:hypothetical protein
VNLDVLGLPDPKRTVGHLVTPQKARATALSAILGTLMPDLALTNAVAATFACPNRAALLVRDYPG